MKSKQNSLVRFWQTIGLLLLNLVIIIAIVYWLTGKAGVQTLRVLVCVGLLAVPTAFFVGVWLGAGRGEAKIEGVEFGVKSVMGAANQVANLRTTMAGTIRQTIRPAAPAAPNVMVIQPTIQPKSLPEGKSEVVEL